MAYKNTETNSSIAQQFGTWRYFNSALQKIPAYKATSYSITPKERPVEQQVNWMGVFGDVAKGALGLFELKRDASYKKADEYLKTHSLQEYKEAMRLGAIPFQDDPLAMQRLKYDHGSLISGLVDAEFNAKIQSGEYKDLNPQELDAQYFRYFNQKSKEASESFSYDSSDYWFTKGLYQNTPSTRLKAGLNNMKVANDWNTKESIFIDTSKLNSIVTNSNSTAQDVINGFDSILTSPKFSHYTPQQQAQFITNSLKTISGRADGAQVLKNLENYKVKIAGQQITARQFVGQLGWNKAILQSHNASYKANAQTYAQTYADVQGKVNIGDYRSLEAELQQELALTNNQLSDKAQYLIKAIERAKDTQKVLLQKQLKDAASAQKQATKESLSYSYLQNLALGRNIAPPSTFGITQTDITRYLQNMIKQNPQGTRDAVWAMATNNLVSFNPAKNMFKNIGRQFFNQFNRQTTMLADNPKAQISKPKQLDTLISLFNKDQESFDQVFDGLSQSQRETIRIFATNQSVGVDYKDIARRISYYKGRMKTPQGRDEVYSLQQSISQGVDMGFSLNPFSPVINDYYAKDTLRSLATPYILMGQTPQDALQKARDTIKKTHTDFKDTIVPNAFFNIPNTNFQDVKLFAQNLYQDYLQSKGWSQDDVAVSFNPRTKSIYMVKDGYKVKDSQFTTADLGQMYINYSLYQARKAQREFDPRPWYEFGPKITYPNKGIGTLYDNQRDNKQIKQYLKGLR